MFFSITNHCLQAEINSVELPESKYTYDKISGKLTSVRKFQIFEQGATDYSIGHSAVQTSKTFDESGKLQEISLYFEE